MKGIDESRAFVPVRMAVLTVSDTRTEKEDVSGPKLAAMIAAAGHEVAHQKVVRDDTFAIRALVESWIVNSNIDVIITTGGTGFTGRDVTPEAMKPLFEKEIDGFAVLFHQLSYEKVGTSTIQSRACAGVVRNTFIFCLPGSPSACEDAWEGILKFQFDSRHRPCNFVQIIPRLDEHRRAAE